MVLLTVRIAARAEPEPQALHADFFEKRHGHVLDAIDNLLKIDHDRKSGPARFIPATYKDTQGRDRPAFDLTRDGFTLLAMGKNQQQNTPKSLTPL